MASAVGLDLKFSPSFCVFVRPSARRVTSERRPSLSTITHSDGFAPGFNAPTAITSGLPSSGMSVGNGSRPFYQLRHADRVFVAAQEKDVGMAVAVPIRRRELAHTGQGGKGLGRGERTVRLLEINRKLATGRLSHEQFGTTVAVDIGPKQAALRRVRFVQRQEFEIVRAGTRRTKFRRAGA